MKRIVYIQPGEKVEIVVGDQKHPIMQITSKFTTKLGRLKIKFKTNGITIHRNTDIKS